MVAETFPDLATNLVYTVLCLVPGFVTVEVATYVSDREFEFDDFERSTWSLVASGLSLSVLYFAYVAWIGITTGRARLVVAVDLQWTELVAAYPLLLGVAVLIGYLLGRLIARIRPLERAVSAPGQERSTE